jgi:hypothetical protein
VTPRTSLRSKGGCGAHFGRRAGRSSMAPSKIAITTSGGGPPWRMSVSSFGAFSAGATRKLRVGAGEDWRRGSDLLALAGTSYFVVRLVR